MTALIGLISGLGLIGLALSLGGMPAAYVNATGMLIVLCGTAAVTMISFSSSDLRDLPKAVRELLFESREEASQAAYFVLRLAERARKDGVLQLPNIPALKNRPMLSKAISLIADGTVTEDVERTLEHESWAAAARRRCTADILRRAGEVAPAMGLIGTLLGLVQLLGQLSNPAAIGPAMAVALLTTFYGAILAHMVFLPLAAKADRSREAEQLINSVYSLGASSIGRKENPRRLEVALNALLPPNKQVQYF